jgi:hypothetical protein
MPVNTRIDRDLLTEEKEIPLSALQASFANAVIELEEAHKNAVAFNAEADRARDRHITASNTVTEARIALQERMKTLMYGAHDEGLKDLKS